jgi:glutamate-1-semialdehyde 2,1-aminomutase
MTTILERYRALHPRSAELHKQAARSFPDGVTHDIRHFAPFPIYVDHALGARKWDADGNEIIDYVMGHGALLLGHAHPTLVRAVTRQIAKGTHYGASTELEMEWAGWIRKLVPSAQKVRFHSSGTEATMMAVRLARAYTGRNKLVRFALNFHGWNDSVVGYVLPEETLPRSPGIPPAYLGEQIVLPQNDIRMLAWTLAEEKDVAAVIVEPTGASASTVPIDLEFLAFMRERTAREGVVLIFDEVVTGFRVGPGGAQERFGIMPDLTALAKIAAGGLPGAAIAGRADILDCIEFRRDAEWNAHGRVAHQGTFNANPLSAAAGIAMLETISDGKPQAHAEEMAKRLCRGANRIMRKLGVKGCAYTFSSMFHMSIGVDCPEPADGWEWQWDGAPGASVPMTPPKVTSAFRQAMLNSGGGDFMRTGGLTSAVHDEKDIDETLAALEPALSEMKSEGTL